MAAAMPWSKVEAKASGCGGSEPHLSARAQEIARSREEMVGLLCGLPESEYELSFTDLVERSTPAPAVVDGEGVTAAAGEEAAAAAAAAAAGQGGDKAKERRVRRTSSERRATAAGGGGGRDGVLLNVYFPRALCRSLNESRVPRATGKRSAADCIKIRDRQRGAFGCWPCHLGERRKGQNKEAVKGN